MKVVFLDRDGTLIEESNDCKIDRLSKLIFKPGVFDALRLLRDNGYELVVVSNQDGIGRPDFSWEDFDTVQDVFLKKFGEQGIRFFEVFICPHLKEDCCECRKPEIGLVRDFFWECEVEAEDSFMIGDRPTDVEFGRRLGVSTIYLQNLAFPLDPLGFGGGDGSAKQEEVNFIAKDIVEAANWIVSLETPGPLVG